MRQVVHLLFPLVVLAACASGAGNATDTFEVAGTIRYVELEGGVYAIEGKDGTRYQPLSLPEPFKRDGIKVRATLKRRDDVMGIYQIGPIVEVVRMAADSSG